MYQFVHNAKVKGLASEIFVWGKTMKDAKIKALGKGYVPAFGKKLSPKIKNSVLENIKEYNEFGFYIIGGK